MNIPDMNGADLRLMNSVWRHHLRNFASSVQAATDYLSSAMDSRLTPQEREYFPLIRKECVEMTRTISRMNLFFDAVQTEPVQILARVIDEMREELRRNMPTLDLKVAMDGQVSARIIRNPQHFRIALSELVTNAHEAAPGKPVAVEIAAAAPDRLMVVVRDSACKADLKPVETWFQPFFTTKAKHLGLGLPVARRMVQHSGGTLSVEYSAQTGSVATFTWPLEQV